MGDAENKPGHRWAVVLSGGEGERMRPFITGWLGSHRPKQYCAFTGVRTLLEDAATRALGVASARRLVTVIGKGHWRYLDEPRRLQFPGRIIEQPANCDTAAGFFLPLAYVLREDPEATVSLLPSDHFVADPYRFQRHLRRALRCAEREPERLFLLAAVPEGPEADYGWVRTGAGATGSGPRPVTEFLEKPDPATARRFYEEGCLWNTLVLAGKARTFWELGRRFLPEVIERLDIVRRFIGTPYEADVSREVYDGMPRANLSRDLLEKAPERLAAVAMDEVGWSDWGRPERILESLRALDLEPAFRTPESGCVPA